MRARHRATPYLLVAPALLVFGGIVLVPIGLTAGFSFYRWDGLGPFEAVGLGNYRRALRDEIFRSSFVHAAVYIGLTIVLEVMVGMALAGLVTARPRRGVFFRTAFFVPVILPMVVIAVLWSFVYNPDIGMLNASLRRVGLESLAHVWLGDPNTALVAISVVSGWVYAGFFMAIFYAAFQQIPASVLEAAQLDGAGGLRIFWHVKVPIVRHTVEVALLLCITGGFQAFDLFFVLTNGGPFHSTEIPTTYLVKVVFRNHEVGYGSAMAVILTAVVVVIGLLYARLRTRRPRIAGGS
jgi:raffinose/stachyose/melibiose transport system permease protein